MKALTGLTTSGVCGARAPGIADSRCTNDGTACGQDGKCDGGGKCRKVADGTQCKAAMCSSNVYTGTSTCNGQGTCVTPAAQTCAPSTCTNGPCITQCTTDGQCSSGSYCDGTSHMCAAKKSLGAACAGTTECATGVCADGVCCNTTCDKACQACDLPDSKGTCTPKSGAPRAGHPTCAGADASCSGSCTGSADGQCTFPTTSCGTCKRCGGGACVAVINQTDASCSTMCDSAGTCVPLPAQLAGSDSVSFGTVAVGTTSNATVWKVTNSGGVATGGLTVENNNANEVLITNGCSASLGPGGSCSISITFKPYAAGSRQGIVKVSATPGGSVMFTATANGVCQCGSANMMCQSGKCVSKVVMLSTGGSNTCSLHADGTLRCWGENSNGELGDGSGSDSKSPKVMSPGVPTISKVFVGSFSTFLVSDLGDIYEFGKGITGIVKRAGLPLNPTKALKVATPIVDECFLSGSSLMCDGDNFSGELGNGTTTRVDPPPIQVLTGATTFSMSNSTSSFTCAILTNQTVKCWGANSFGQLGDGTRNEHLMPFLVPNVSQVAEVLLDGARTFARTTGGRVYCWGDDQLGFKFCGNHSSDSPVLPTDIGLSNVAQISVAAGEPCARFTNGSVSCWGVRKATGVGYGGVTEILPAGSATFLATDGLFHHCLLQSDGAVLCWGKNDAGQLGDGTTTNSATPIAPAW